MNRKNIGIIGLGKLGLPLAALFAQKYPVKGVDLSEKRIMDIGANKPFFEPQLNKYLEASNLQASTDYGIIEKCNPVFIIVQTPSRDEGLFDTSYVKHALSMLNKVNQDCLAVISSTVNIGTIDELKKVHKNLAYNPEFIKQGSIIHDFLNPCFVLIGTDNPYHYKQIAAIWKKFHDQPQINTSICEAEAIKLLLNFSLTVDITFTNTIGEICKHNNLNSKTVLDTIYRDRRSYYPGLGYGGPCFPRDVACLKEYCRVNKLDMGETLARTIQDLNIIPLQKVIQEVIDSKAKSVTILGISYKPKVPYVYESQPLMIAKELIEKNIEVHIYDQFAEEEARRHLPEAIYHSSIEEAIEQGETTIIGTHNYSSNKKTIDSWK